MFLRFVIVAVFLGGVHSAIKLSSEEIVSKVTDKVQLNFYTYVDKLFKSDKFVPVGTSSAFSLQATSYSSTGFLKQSVYSKTDGSADTTCSSLTYVSGYAANVCFQTDNYAFMFKLTTGASDCTGGVVQYFNDRKCNQYLGSSPLAGEQNTCTASTSANGIVDNAYEILQCDTSTSPDLIANSVTSGLYPNTKCSGSPFGYINFSPAMCTKMVISDVLTVYVKYTCPSSNSPGFTVYTDAACTEEDMAPASFRSTCSAGNDDAADDVVSDNSAPFFVNPPPSVSTTPLPGSQDMPASNNYYCTAKAPTAKPAFAPTAFPTGAVATAVSFDIKQTLRGIDASTFNANPENAVVLIQTIAGTMTGVTPANILNLAVSGSRRRLKAEPVNQAARQLQAGSAVTSTATYTVSVTSVYSANQLRNELTTSVNSGAFTTDLNDNAASNGNSDLVGASSNSFPSDDKKKTLSTGAIIGIVIGGFAFIVLVIMICWCLCCRGSGYSQPNHGNTVAA